MTKKQKPKLQVSPHLHQAKGLMNAGMNLWSNSGMSY